MSTTNETIEYVIVWKDDTEDIFDTKEEAEKIIKEEWKDRISQYYRKTWVYVDWDWVEDDVKVYI